MKKILLSLLTFLVVTSCSKQPKCNDPEVQKLVVETLKKEISKNVESLLKNDENIISSDNFKSFQPLFKNHDLYLKELEYKIR